MKRKSQHTTPPKLAQRFLLWFLKDELAEEVLGDLNEKFHTTLEKRSISKARFNCWYQVFHYLRPFAFRFFTSKHSGRTSMINHHFKVSFRQLLRNRTYSLINIGGLAIGMTVATLIGLWVHDELSYNKNYKHYDRIVRVMRQNGNELGYSTGPVLTTGMGTVLRENLSDYFERVVIVRARLESRVIANGELMFTENGYFMQDGAIQMFSLNMIHGNEKALSERKSILLSASLAQKLFGDENPVSKLIKFNGATELVVTGVYEDLPKNATFNQASYIAPLSLYLGTGENTMKLWNNYNMYVFAQLIEQADRERVSAMITSTFELYFDEWAKGSNMTFFLHPMSDWRLYSAWDQQRAPVTSQALQFVRIYALIGLFVLILACINFMNLSTARSAKRAKEVGIRKTLGSVRRQLIAQFYTESLLYSLLALSTSLLMTAALLPWFNEASGKQIATPWASQGFWLIASGATFFTALLAGSYPAIFLSSFKPLKALKGVFTKGHRASVPRKALVIFQFTISIALIVGTITVNNQIQFAKNRPVGYSPEGMLSLKPASPDFHKKLPLLITELEKTGMVESVGASDYPVTNTRGTNGNFYWDGMENTSNISFNAISVSQGYGSTVGLQFIAGRDFSANLATEEKSVLINRSAQEAMNLENPVGQRLTYAPSWKEAEHYTIIGVVEDMIKGSPFENTYQSIIFLNRKVNNWLYLRLSPEVSISEAIPTLREKFSAILPEAPFDYQFADVEYDIKFRQEERVAELAGFFCLLAVMISALGLFGLSSYTAEQRTKEIGIRKVLGASITHLWQLLTTEFVVLVSIASLVSIPLTFRVLDGWLQSYELHTSLHWWVFALAALLAFIITLLTVSVQAVKTAIANPVKSLRTE